MFSSSNFFSRLKANSLINQANRNTPKYFPIKILIKVLLHLLLLLYLTFYKLRYLDFELSLTFQISEIPSLKETEHL